MAESLNFFQVWAKVIQAGFIQSFKFKYLSNLIIMFKYFQELGVKYGVY